MLAWAQREHGKHVTQHDVQAALRSLGMKVRAMPVLGTGKSAGFYCGTPKGVSLKGVAVRQRPNAKASA